MQDTTRHAASAPADGPGAAQSRYWNSPATAPWVALQERLDALLDPLSRAAMQIAEPLPGENALDVGCGCGATSLDIAQRVGASGRVHAVDISAPMLDRARQRAAGQGLTQVVLTLADAATFAFPPGSFDLVFSRLGVMFFDDPVAAFTNLHRAMKPSGRLVFVCCRTPAENQYITAAVQAARPLLPPGALPEPRPEEPGMFSFADADRARRILETAGFRDVVLVHPNERMRLAGPGNAADAAAFSIQFGPLTRVTSAVKAELSEAIRAAVAQAYRDLEGPDGIVLDGAFWIVSARA